MCPALPVKEVHNSTKWFVERQDWLIGGECTASLFSLFCRNVVKQVAHFFTFFIKKTALTHLNHNHLYMCGSMSHILLVILSVLQWWIFNPIIGLKIHHNYCKCCYGFSLLFCFFLSMSKSQKRWNLIWTTSSYLKLPNVMVSAWHVCTLQHFTSSKSLQSIAYY